MAQGTRTRKIRRVQAPPRAAEHDESIKALITKGWRRLKTRFGVNIPQPRRLNSETG